MAHEYSFPVVVSTVPTTFTLDQLTFWFRNLVARRALTRLTSNSLRDVYFSEAERMAEIDKPFWR